VCNSLTWKCFEKNLVHSNLIFMTNIQLVLKWSHFVITLISILCITIVANAHNHIYIYNMTNSNFNCTCNNNLWLSLNQNNNNKWIYVFHDWWHSLMINHQIAFIIAFETIRKWLNDMQHLIKVYKLIYWSISKLKTQWMLSIGTKSMVWGTMVLEISMWPTKQTKQTNDLLWWINFHVFVHKFYVQ